jgi:hypothetical protein
VVGPYYQNDSSLAQRVETARRQMIAELEQPAKKKKFKRKVRPVKRHVSRR